MFTLMLFIVSSFECLVEPSLHVGRADISAGRTTRAITGLGDSLAKGSGGKHHHSYG